MNLYLLRHGEAEIHASHDAARALTDGGCQDVITVARQFAARHLPLDRCLASPYERAQQTARLFLERQSDAPDVETEPSLTPDMRATQVIDLLAGIGQGNLLLVSHNPLVSELVALLVEGSVSRLSIMGTAELVAISLDIPGLGMGVRQFSLLPGRDRLTTPARFV